MTECLCGDTLNEYGNHTTGGEGAGCIGSLSARLEKLAAENDASQRRVETLAERGDQISDGLRKAEKLVDDLVAQSLKDKDALFAAEKELAALKKGLYGSHHN